MNINVRYVPSLMRTIRLNLYMRRQAMWMLMALGALAFVVLVLTMGVDTTALTVLVLAVGIACFIEVPLVTWLQVYANRKRLLQEAEITLTSEGIIRRTATTTQEVTWDVVRRIHEQYDRWIFVWSRLPATFISLPKQALTPEQQAELTAFIAARNG